MHTQSVLLGRRAGDQLAAVPHVPFAAAAQLIVQVGVAALGVAEVNDTAPATPNDATAMATAIPALRIPAIMLRSVPVPDCAWSPRCRMN
jgi:hypothetical protein